MKSKKRQIEDLKYILADYETNRSKCWSIKLMFLGGIFASIADPNTIDKVIDTICEELKRQIKDIEEQL